MLDQPNDPTESHGARQPGKGMVTGMMAPAMGAPCCLGLMAFQFLQDLSMPAMRLPRSHEQKALNNGAAAHRTILHDPLGNGVKSTPLWPARYRAWGDGMSHGLWQAVKFSLDWKTR